MMMKVIVCMKMIKPRLYLLQKTVQISNYRYMLVNASFSFCLYSTLYFTIHFLSVYIQPYKLIVAEISSHLLQLVRVIHFGDHCVRHYVLFNLSCWCPVYIFSFHLQLINILYWFGSLSHTNHSISTVVWYCEHSQFSCVHTCTHTRKHAHTHKTI